MATQRVLLGNIRGPKGETGATGPTGPAGTISVGTVTKGEYGTPPQVINSGSSTAATFDFVIPEGAPGDTVAALDNLTLDAPTASTATLPIPAAGERGKVIFGKIIKFCNDIKNLASTSANGLLRALSGNTSQWLRGDGSWQTAQNNLTTTAAGYVLDARQGKTLKTQLDSLNDSINNKGRFYTTEPLTAFLSNVISDEFNIFTCTSDFTALVTRNDAQGVGVGFASYNQTFNFVEGMIYVNASGVLYAFRVLSNGTLDTVKKCTLTAI